MFLRFVPFDAAVLRLAVFSLTVSLPFLFTIKIPRSSPSIDHV